MRILLIHNHYRQPGGEDTVFEAEKALLERHGHEVVTFVEDNARLEGINPLKVAVNAIWSREAQRNIRKLIEQTRPNVVHFHNTFLRISPAAYYVMKEMGIPVVQSLHNQRIFCAKATMYRGGTICIDCVSRIIPYPAILHKCYRGSFSQTSVVACMQIIHRILHTWEKKVDIYITFTKFFKEKFIEWGLPKEKIVIKPHFVYPDPGYTFYKKNYTLFIGRLDPEKGIETLLNAWRKINIPLLILGKGRLADIVQMHSNVNPAIYWLPHRLSRNEVLELIKNARFLIWPSLGWYENFGMVAIESFSCGTPVIASKTGAMAEIVEDGRTGLLFEPGNPEDLAARVAWAWAHPEEMGRMGKAARQEFEEKYTAEKNYQMLMQIYERARAQR